MAALAPLGTPNAQLAIALKQLSAAKFGTPRAKVDADIIERLKRPEPAKPAFGAGGAAGFGAASPFGPPAGAGGPPVPKAPPKPASFLDDWLAKRQGGAPGSAPGIAPGGTPAPSAPTFGQQPTQSPFGQQPAAAPYNPESGPASPEFRSGGPSAPASPFAGPPSIQASQSSLEAPMLDSAVPEAPAMPTGPSMPQLSDMQAHAAPMAQHKNISSNELEEQEAGKIAAQLKQELSIGQSSNPGMPISPAAEPPVTVTPPDEDTIFIDREGNMTFKQDATPPPTA
jgi:hypothetical protein